MKARLGIVLGLTALFPNVLMAQRSDSILPDTSSIATVVIEATLRPDSLHKIPASIGVISAQQLQANNGVAVTNAMNAIPGVYMQQGALNTNRIAIRGVGARTQFGTNRIKAYLAGIPITDAAGTTVIEDIDVSLLERIEVLKGPNSSFYGAGLAGALMLYPKKIDGTSFQVGSTLGSFGFLRNSLSASIGDSRGGLRLAYNRLSTDGYRSNSDYRRQSLTLNGNLELSAKSKLTVFANLIRLDAEIPSSLSFDNFQSNPQMADQNWERAKGYESYDKLVAGVAFEHQYSSRVSVEASVFGQFRDGYEPRPFDILSESSQGIGARAKISLENAFIAPNAFLTLGAEYLHEDYALALFENRYLESTEPGSIQGDLINAQDQDRAYLNVFIEQIFPLSSKLEFTAGVNLNYTTYTLYDRFPGDSIDQSGSYPFDPIASPRLGATYQISREHHLYASVSQGFSMPGVEEALTPSGAQNTDLKPEIGINAELGYRAKWLEEKLWFEMAVYGVFVRNLLVARRIDEDQFIGINVGRTRHLGSEISLRYKTLIARKFLLQPHLSSSFHHYRFIDFTDLGEDYSGNKLTGVPAYQFNFGVDASWINGLGANVYFLGVGAIPLNDANTAFTDFYGLLNTKISYTFRLGSKWKFDLSAGLNNVLDINYAASVLPNAVGFGGRQPRYYYPGDGRNYYFGLAISY